MLRRNKEGKMSANDVYIITPPKQAAVAVEGDTRLFPVRRIFCVGRNYADHAREMGADPDRELPFFFCKPADARGGRRRDHSLPAPDQGSAA